MKYLTYLTIFNHHSKPLETINEPRFNFRMEENQPNSLVANRICNVFGNFNTNYLLEDSRVDYGDRKSFANLMYVRHVLSAEILCPHSTFPINYYILLSNLWSPWRQFLTYCFPYCSIETAGLQVYGGFYNAAHRSYDVTSFVAILLTSLVTTVVALRWR